MGIFSKTYPNVAHLLHLADIGVLPKLHCAKAWAMAVID
jgi:hypothetical protein